MTSKRVAFWAILTVVILYLAGGEALVTNVLQYLLQGVGSMVQLVINLLVGLAHILGLKG